jgi:hypothetical protein
MKTYKSECKELLDWATAEEAKIDAEVKASGFVGFDGPGTEKYKNISEEYYRRLSELKIKHGKTQATQETDFPAKGRKIRA